MRNNLSSISRRLLIQQRTNLIKQLGHVQTSKRKAAQESKFSANHFEIHKEINILKAQIAILDELIKVAV